MARLGLRRSPRLLSSPAVTTPMAAGILRPTIFLPSAQTWTAEQREIVSHEIAHLVALDPLALSHRAWRWPAIGSIRRLDGGARSRGRARAGVRRGGAAPGTRPSSYARVLLEFADALGSREVRCPSFNCPCWRNDSWRS